MCGYNMHVVHVVMLDVCSVILAMYYEIYSPTVSVSRPESPDQCHVTHGSGVWHTDSLRVIKAKPINAYL